MAGLPPGRPSSQASMMAGGRFLLRRPIGAFIHLGGTCRRGDVGNPDLGSRHDPKSLFEVRKEHTS